MHVSLCMQLDSTSKGIFFGVFFLLNVLAIVTVSLWKRKPV